MSNTMTNAPAGTAITGFDLIGCTVSDVQRSLAFYRDTLGLQPSYVSDGGVEFEFPNGETFGLWKPEGGEYPLGLGVMFSVADAKAAVDLFNSRGAKLSEPFESPVCKMAMGQDPDGNGFIIHQRTQKNDPTPPAHVHTPTSINGVDWAGYFISKPEASIAYYRDVLGIKPSDIYESGRGAEFDLADGTTFGIWQGDNNERGGTLMFAVDDAKAAVLQLRERGAQVSDANDLGDCYMAITADPDGITIIIHQRK